MSSAAARSLVRRPAEARPRGPADRAERRPPGEPSPATWLLPQARARTAAANSHGSRTTASKTRPRWTPPRLPACGGCATVYEDDRGRPAAWIAAATGRVTPLRLTVGCSTQRQRILSKGVPPGRLGHPTELTRGNARPAPEGAREVGMVRVSEIERDIENRRVGFLEEPD